MSKRKPASVLLFCALSLPLLNCGSPQHSVEERYYLVATNIKIPYWQAAGAGWRQAATQLGVKFAMVGPETYDPQAEHEEFQKILKEKPTGILISVANPEVMTADIDAAIAQGIPVITIDSDAPNSKRLMFIGTNNYAAGQIGGRLVAKQLQGKGNVAVYTMPGQTNLEERLKGYRDIFAGHPQIKIAEIVDVKGDPRIAFDKTSEIADQRRDKFDAFVCLEATACEEIAEVLDRKKVPNKLIMAMDTNQGTLEGIQKGTIAATIAQKPFTMAYVGLKALDDLYHHKLPSLDARSAQDPFATLPNFVDTGSTLIDKSSVAGFIQASAGKKM